MYGHLSRKTGKLIAAFVVICAMTVSLMTGCVISFEPGFTTAATTTATVAETSATKKAKVSKTTAETSESLTGATDDTASPQPEKPDKTDKTDKKSKIDEGGTYDKADDVALYIHTYGKLPSNFITKKEAKKLGWSGGSLEKYAKGKCIGGDHYGNYEGLLPEKKGRSYTECDIETLGKSSRGSKRIVFSNDGLIYYTKDHYKTFTLMYGEEKK